MSDTAQAVFISYASQDANAASRICQALRAAGIEVWFDQSELRGGDAWDQKIRREIRDCALFIPVISVNTAARAEGYFRLEWSLAEQRSHMIARNKAFIVPVCLDRTPDSAADVPELFQRVQWTRLHGGDMTPAFVQRIATLLSPDARLVPRAGEHSEHPTVDVRAQGAEIASSANALKQEIRFARVADGTRIAFATTGSGYPLVNAAHWLGHLEFDLQTPIWLPWIERLSARYQLTRYDSRGCGLSDRDVSSVRLEDLVADLEAVVDAAGLERFALLGKSQGGAISIAYTARHPERVSHLVLCGAFARGRLGRHPGLRERAAVEGLIQMVKVGWGESNSAFRQLFTNLFFPQATPEQMIAFNSIQRQSTSPAHAARLLRAFARVDASSHLERISCPTLVIHSRGDAVIPLEEGRFLAGSIAGARFESIDTQNHVPLAGEPAFERIFDLLREFLPMG